MSRLGRNPARKLLAARSQLWAVGRELRAVGCWLLVTAPPGTPRGGYLYRVNAGTATAEGKVVVTGLGFPFD